MREIRTKNASKRIAHIDLNRPSDKQSSSSASSQSPSPPVVSPAPWSPPALSPVSGRQEPLPLKLSSSLYPATSSVSPTSMKHSMSSSDDVMYHTVSGADGRRMASELALEREKQRRAALNRAVVLRLKLEQQRDQMRRSVCSVHTVSAGATSNDSHLVERAASIVDEESRTRLGPRKQIKSTSEEDAAHKSLASRMRSTPEEADSHAGDHNDVELRAWDRAYSSLGESVATTRSEVNILVPPRESSKNVHEHMHDEVVDSVFEDGSHPASGLFNNALGAGAWLASESLCQARARGKFLIFT
jgi:hypothetical protein